MAIPGSGPLAIEYSFRNIYLVLVFINGTSLRRWKDYIAHHQEMSSRSVKHSCNKPQYTIDICPTALDQFMNRHVAISLNFCTSMRLVEAAYKH
jgi:hypothetical protein